MTPSPVTIQTSSQSRLSTPSWMGEVVLIAEYLRKHGVLTKINERVHFARRRFGHYEVIDFLAVLFGYAISEERTLEAFYKRLQPFAHSRTKIKRLIQIDGAVTWLAVKKYGVS